MALTEDAGTRPLDPDVAQRTASDPGASAWVGASAGTGKTKVLTDRVLRIMLAGTLPHRILCLTFTKAAAAEMATRLARRLSLWAVTPDDALTEALHRLTGVRPTAADRDRARRLFAGVVDCPGGIKILTIHSFCQSLLARFPLEAGLAPHFEVMDEGTAAELREAAEAGLIAQARRDPASPVGRALARLTADLAEEAFHDVMAEIASERAQLRRILDDHGGLDGAVAQVRIALGVQDSRDEREILTDACSNGAFDEPGLRHACAALATGTGTDVERGKSIQAWLDSPERPEGFEAYAALFLTKDETLRKTLMTKKPATSHPGAADALRTEGERVLAVREAAKAASVAASTAALLTVADALLAEYEARKTRRSFLDYDDLVLAARQLLHRPTVASWVLFKLDGGLDHILIDEAQDTNPEQWQVVQSLAEEFFAGEGARNVARTIFAVGDEKQSIFSFQRAAPAEFARMRAHFQRKVGEAEQSWRAVSLDTSFRSTDAVLRCVDAVFAGETARDGVAFDPDSTIRHRAHRRGMGGQVQLWPLVAPEAEEDPEPWQPPLRPEPADTPYARLAAVIADTIRHWIDRDEVLEARGRSVVPGDVLVLVRRRSAFVPELVRCLKDRGVPVAGVDRMVLVEQLAVMDLMALADFLLLPEDDLTLATILKGPLIGLEEEDLFALAHQRPGTLWDSLTANAPRDARWTAARTYLAELLRLTDFVPPFELFAGLLARPCPADPVSGRRAILGRLGPDATDPLDEFLQACLDHQRQAPPSLQGLLHWLRAARSEVKREQDQAGGAVRIMTVHAAKGLQAPIVFLPDSARTPTQSARILWPDGDRKVPLFAPRRAVETAVCQAARERANQRRDQEYRRLLYVALTRAEDRLIICGWQGKQEAGAGSWYRLVESALPEGAVARDFDFRDCSPAGWEGRGWFLRDPQVTDPKLDIATDRVVEPPLPAPAWAWVPPADEPDPPRPLIPSRPEEDEPPVHPPLGSIRQSRFLRGNLIHRLLQSLPDLDPARRAHACERYLAGPAHGLDPTAQAEIAHEVMAILDDPRFTPLFGPGSRAEVPLVGLVNGRSVSGQIDRLLVDQTRVTIIDYKTNRPPPERVEDVAPLYRHQMALYRLVLRQIYPDRLVRCLLLWTDGPSVMLLTDPLLDAAEARLLSATVPSADVPRFG